MRSSKSPRMVAVEVLSRVFKTRAYAEILLDNEFRRVSLSGKDRSLATEIVYGTLRWHRWLEWILKDKYSGEWSDCPSAVRQALETGLYQILFLDRIPDYASVDEAVKITLYKKGRKWANRVNGILREIIRHRDSIPPILLDEDPVAGISIRYSHPEWIVERWIRRFGVDRTIAICRANNQTPGLTVRINRLRLKPEEGIERLKSIGLSPRTSEILNEFVTIENGQVLLNSDYFKKGLFSIQDVSAGLVSHLLNPRPGEKILDLAAAPGGKSTHIAELCGDGSFIVAVDSSFTRIKRLEQNRIRLCMGSIYPLCGNIRELSLPTFDKVLLDVPCSGIGVIRKRPEVRYHRKPEDVQILASTQRKMIESAARFVKDGGIMVYSTCTVLLEENHEIIDSFLKSNPNFVVEDGREFVDPGVVSERGFVETWPDIHGIDGSFAVRLKKRE